MWHSTAIQPDVHTRLTTIRRWGVVHDGRGTRGTRRGTWFLLRVGLGLEMRGLVDDGELLGLGWNERLELGHGAGVRVRQVRRDAGGAGRGTSGRERARVVDR